ncbi:hypothetical protein GX48_04906 [Paracoccidioides brasiliensis]|nr:hypothetical protein GX48_04906 [Paracoccidioides brasiliensis]
MLHPASIGLRGQAINFEEHLPSLPSPRLWQEGNALYQGSNVILVDEHIPFLSRISRRLPNPSCHRGGYKNPIVAVSSSSFFFSLTTTPRKKKKKSTCPYLAEPQALLT